MSDDFCLIHGYEHMKTQWGNPIPYCGACDEGRSLITQVEKQAAACYCGKDGHALNSVNCPVHGYITIPIMRLDLENRVAETLRTFDLDGASGSYEDELVKASKAVLEALTAEPHPHCP